jgi:hypothetical protein
MIANRPLGQVNAAGRPYAVPDAPFSEFNLDKFCIKSASKDKPLVAPIRSLDNLDSEQVLV